MARRCRSNDRCDDRRPPRRPPMPDSHYKLMAPMLLQRQIIPLLGAGANRCGRRPGAAWRKGCDLPDGRELAGHLAASGEYPADEVLDLVRVSQYIAVKLGMGALYDRLHEVFDHPFEPTPMRSSGRSRRPASRSTS